MKVTVLGSGGSEGIPVPYCDCRVCKGGDHRFRTSYLITVKDKNILVECGPDFRAQQLKHNFSLDYLFISHQHNDHIEGLHDLRHIMLISKVKMKKINLLVSNKLHKDFLDKSIVEKEGIRYAYNRLIKKKKFNLSLMDYYKEYNFKNFSMFLFKNPHENKVCDAFLLKAEGKTIIYLGDVGKFYSKSIEIINNTNPDLLIINIPRFYSIKPKHVGIEDLTDLKAKKILISHFSHRTNLLHHEIEKEAKKYNNDMIVAQDGLIIDV